MSEFEAIDGGVASHPSSAFSSGYELTGPPKALPITALGLLLSAVVVTLFSGDSVLAFALAVTHAARSPSHSFIK